MFGNKRDVIIKVILLLILVALISSFKAFFEVRYYFGREEIIGEIVGVEEVRYTKNSKRKRIREKGIDVLHRRFYNYIGANHSVKLFGNYKIHYSFVNTSTGKKVRDYSRLGSDAVEKYKVGQKIDIDYYGKEIVISRMKDAKSNFWIFVFVANFLLLSILSIILKRIE